MPADPIAKACDIRNRGVMPKTLVKSARRPVNIKLDSNTSFCTSLAMLSTVPGLGKPSAALRSENDPYASLITAATELCVRNDSAEVKSDILQIYCS